MTPQHDPLLLQRAREIALEQRRKVDALHVLVAALTDHQAAGRAWPSLRNVLSEERCVRLAQETTAFIRATIDPPSIPDTTPENTPNLDTAERFWKQDAASREKPVTAALMLTTILTKDNRTNQWLRAQQVPVEQLVNELSLVLDEPDSYVPTASALPLLSAVEQTQERDRKAEAYLKEYVKRVQIEHGLHYAKLNVPRLNGVLSSLAASASETGGMDVTVCLTTPGSVLELLANMLAERAAIRDGYPASLSVLHAVQEVRVISLRSLLLGASVDENIDPARVLRVAKREAAKAKALLIVEHVEALVPLRRGTAAPSPTTPATGQQIPGASASTAQPATGDTTGGTPPVGGRTSMRPALDMPVEPHAFTEDELRALRTEFTRQGQFLVLGYYYVDPDPETDVRQIQLPAELNRQNLRVVSVGPFTGPETEYLLRTFYVPIWAVGGYEVNPEAFQLIFDLSPYAWIGQRRRSLPMLAVELATKAMETAEQGVTAADTTIDAALRTLERYFGPAISQARNTGTLSLAAVASSQATLGPARFPLDQARREILALKEQLHPTGFGAKVGQMLRRPSEKEIVEAQLRTLRTLPAGLLLAHLLADEEWEFYPPGERPPGARSGEYHMPVESAREQPPSTPNPPNSGQPPNQRP